MTITRFSFPTTIHFGPGARKLVADHLKAEGIKRPLIVTDRGIAPLPLLADFVAGLPGLEVGVFSEIWGNPVRSQVKQGAAAYKAHNADAVIGLGGGAALLAHLIGESRREPGLTQLKLTVTETNVAARRLYEKFGFRSFGIEPRAIRVGDTHYDKNHMIHFLAQP